MQSNYQCAYVFQMPNGVDQRSDDAIACPLPNGVNQRSDDAKTKNFNIRYAEALNQFEQNTSKIFFVQLIMWKTLMQSWVDQPSDLAVSYMDQFGSYDKLALVCSDFPIVTHHILIIPFYCYANSIAIAYIEFWLENCQQN